MWGIFPVGVEVEAGGRVSRWCPLINWLLALPLLLWLSLVSAGGVAVVVVAWSAIVVAGRMPDRLGDYLVGMLRYGWRVGAFLFGLTSCYPGFRVVAGYVDPCDQPAVLYSAQPLVRNRVTVLFRLVLLLPALLFVVPAVIVLIALLFAAWWIVLILGRWPDVLRRDVAGCFRYLLRFASYAWLIVDVFPPVIPDPDPITAEDTRAFLTVEPDPKDVTGPPWPRLVGSETYQPPGLLRWPIAAGVVLLVLSLRSLQAPAPAPSQTQATVTSSPPTGEIIDDLEGRMMPAPAGYMAGAGIVWPNGITPATYDQKLGVGSAAYTTFLGGYDESYQSDAGDYDIVDIQLFRFASPQNASLAMGLLVSLPAEEAAKQSAFPAIRGAMALDATKPFEGFYDHEVGATKGPLVMLLDYVDSNAGPVPIDLTAWAEQEYQLL